MRRAWGGLVLGAALLMAAPSAVSGQVFVASSPRPDLAIGPLFVGATAPAELATPVNISVTWNLVHRRAERRYAQTLALLWPAEVAAATVPGDRETQRRPERGLSVGFLTTLRHWDVERHEVEIELEDDRVQDVVVHVRRSRGSSPD